VALTALAFVLVIGSVDRLGCVKQIASYLGLVPAEESSGDRRRLGHISQQGSALLRFFLVQAAQVTARSDLGDLTPSSHGEMEKTAAPLWTLAVASSAGMMVRYPRRKWLYLGTNVERKHDGSSSHRIDSRTACCC
jgi:transposase